MKIQKKFHHRHRSQNARYVRSDKYNQFSNTLPTYFVIDTENNVDDPIPCENAVHACALASKKNRQWYRGEVCNWTKFVACYKDRDSFRMLEFEKSCVV